ncbi:MAG: hypothetical protein ACK44Q_07390, partial [Pirellulaceae bacterium]
MRAGPLRSHRRQTVEIGVGSAWCDPPLGRGGYLACANDCFVATGARRWKRSLVARATIHRVAAVAPCVRACP